MARLDWRTVLMAAAAGILLAACSPEDENALAAESASDGTTSQVAVAPPSGTGASGITADAGNSTPASGGPPLAPADVAPALPQPAAPSTNPELPVEAPSVPQTPEAPSTNPLPSEVPSAITQPPEAPATVPQPPEDQPEIPDEPEILPIDPESPVEATPDPEAPAEEPAPEPQANNAPSISGSAAASTMVGVAWSFTPTASDQDGDALSWSITGKPTDATFSTVTGKLTWTPQAAGVWSNIVVTVTDSAGASASLPPFSITVEQTVVSGTATVRWEVPLEYSDGTALPASVLASYRIYHGTSESSLTRIAEVDSLTTSLAVADMEQGTHYFAVMAISDTGEEGVLSAIVSKLIP